LVEQAMVIVDTDDKREALRRLIRSEDVKNALIFCNRKRDVDILARSLVKHGFDAAALHGDMSQPKRTETLERFKNSEIRLLVASDVAARGLDIQGLSHVFNFDVPHHAEDYVHRIGRTGRAGREGRSFTLAAPEDGKNVAAIQKLIGKDIPVGQIDGIETAALDFEAGDRRRGRGRAAPARGEAADRHQPRPARREETQEKRREERAPRRSERPARAELRRAVAEDNVTAFPRPAAEPRRQPERRPAEPRRPEPEHRVVGFGDDLPAFLRRAPKVAVRA
jgi:superfamily II DNA/RNA helicase